MRFLAPNDFGRFAMVLIIFNFLQIIRDCGFSQALIQTNNNISVKISTAFWSQVLIAAFISIFLYQNRQFFDWVFNNTNLTLLVKWIAIDFFIGSLGLTPTAILNRQLAFRKLFYIKIIALGISSIIGIYLAFNGYGVYALIAKLMFWTSINSIGNLIACSSRPKFQYSFLELRQMAHFGFPLSGNAILNYTVRNLDDFLIGKVISENALGLYNRAYSIMLLPLGNITNVLRTVFISSWSRIQENKSLIANNYTKLIGLIAGLTFPLMILLSVLSLPITSNIFGEHWLEMSTTLSILAIIGMLQSVSGMVGVIYIVLNKTKTLFKISLASSAYMILIIIGAVYHFKTIELVALAYGLASFSLIFPHYYFLSKLLEISFFKLLAPIFFPLLLSCIIGIFAHYTFYYLPVSNELFKLAISIIISLFFYLLILYFLKAQIWIDAMKTINEYKNGSYV